MAKTLIEMAPGMFIHDKLILWKVHKREFPVEATCYIRKTSETHHSNEDNFWDYIAFIHTVKRTEVNIKLCLILNIFLIKSRKILAKVTNMNDKDFLPLFLFSFFFDKM